MMTGSRRNCEYVAVRFLNPPGLAPEALKPPIEFNVLGMHAALFLDETCPSRNAKERVTLSAELVHATMGNVKGEPATVRLLYCEPLE
mmetsp:Transcript_82194/g.154980  ORF Transcript_82194/g.154980 Transcript_82194/m.154980 type:complete len:88 (+) Transcript_82194:1838-2101(+)